MLDQQTYDKLQDMRLRGMASAFRETQERGADEALGFAERFGLLVEREWAERQDRSLKRRLQLAKLREPGARLEDVLYDHPRKLSREQVERLASCQWIRRKQAVLLTGPTGVGKTWIACALGNQACRQGFSVAYHRLSRLLEKLRLARADGSYARELGRLARTDVLVLDDWGLAVLEDEPRRDLLEVLEDRRNRGSTVVTSQLPVAQWHDVLGDPTIADSILDRLVHHAHRFELNGPSLRKRKPKDSAEERER